MCRISCQLGLPAWVGALLEGHHPIGGRPSLMSSTWPFAFCYAVCALALLDHWLVFFVRFTYLRATPLQDRHLRAPVHGANALDTLSYIITVVPHQVFVIIKSRYCKKIYVIKNQVFAIVVLSADTSSWTDLLYKRYSHLAQLLRLHLLGRQPRMVLQFQNGITTSHYCRINASYRRRVVSRMNCCQGIVQSYLQQSRGLSLP